MLRLKLRVLHSYGNEPRGGVKNKNTSKPEIVLARLLLRFAKSCRRTLKIAGFCFKEARPVVQGIFLLRLLVGVFFGASILSPEFDGGFILLLLGGAVSWMSTTLAAYLYNGIQDVEEDRANGSSRPVARGELKVPHAMLAVGVFGALGLIGSIFTYRDLVWGVVAMFVMGWLYSGPPLYLKRYPTALAVIATVSAVLTYHIGFMIGGERAGHTPFMIFAGVMALWMGLVGQSKDLSDIDGDRLVGRKSLPVVWGENAARLAISGVALAIGLGFLLTSLFVMESLMLAAVIVLMGALFVAVVSLGRWSRSSRTERRRPYRAFMATQYAANLAVIFLPTGI